MRGIIAMMFIVGIAVVSASDSVLQAAENGRQLQQAGCTILGKPFSACYSVDGGTVGYSLQGTTLSVGFKGGDPSNWSGWTVGNPHRGSSAVFNIQGKTSARTMNGKSAAQITSPSRVKFSSVKGGTDGGQLAATFTLKWPGGNSVPVAFGTGPGNLGQHYSTPRTYRLNKSPLSMS